MAYIGHSPSTGEDNNFKILDDISSYTLTFDGSDSSVVSTSDETIYSYNHRFVQGQRVRYTNGGGGDINGLTNNSYYFIIKHDHNNIKLATSASNATDGTAVNITAVGSGSSHTLNVAFDGVNTKFKATHTTGQKARITRGAQLVLSVNGVIQQPHDSSSPSTGFGFDLDGTIVFSQAPQSTDAFWGHILTNNNVTFDITDNKVDHFTGNGSTSSFTLSKSPPNNENILVTIDGVVQYPNDSAGNIRAYATVANVINFTTAPGTGTQIEVRHIGFAGAVTGAGGGGVTGFYGRTGNVTLVNTDNIAVNNANISGNAIVTGDLTVNGTTTTLDTILTEVDRIEVLDSSSNVAVAITQNGDGDILNLYDGSNEVFSVVDGGITRIKKGVQLIAETSNLYATDGALSYYATNNAVYLNGAGNSGRLRLNATGSNNDRTSINLCGQSVNNAQDAIIFKTATNERFRINAAGNIKVQDDVQLQFGGVSYTSASEFQIYHSSLENHVGLTTHPLIISSTDGERMRIHNDYVVSIGNTNISSLTQPARLRIQGSYVNNIGPFGILEFKNRENSGNATASIRANRDAVAGGNYSAGLTFHTNSANPATADDGDNERMVITSTGQVGIGITNPNSYQSSSKDLVIGKTDNAAGITIRSGTNNGGYITFANDGSGAGLYKSRIAYDHQGDKLTFSTNGTARLFILGNAATNGQIGINTATPINDFTLLTDGNGYVDFHGSGGGGAEMNVYKKQDKSLTYKFANNGGANELAQHYLTNASGKFLWYIGGTSTANEKMRLENNGRLGIGTANPSKMLTVRGSILKTRTDSGVGLIYLQTDGSQNGQIVVNQNGGVTRVQLHSAGDSYFNGGDLSLGTTSPNSYTNQRVFTINGTTHGRLDLEVGGTLKGSVWADSGGLALDAGGETIEMYTGSAQRVFINTSGQMGIGQNFTPSRQLDVKDATGANRIMNIRGTGTSGAFLAFLDANTTDDSKCRIGSIGGNNIGIRGDSHSFQDGAGTNRMTIDSSGVVQIDQGTAGGNHFKIKNDEIVLLAGANGTGDTYEREAFFGVTRLDSGSLPILRLAGQGGIKFCVDANSERVLIDSSGRVKIGGSAVSQNRNLVIGSNSEANLAIETHNTSASETANIRFYRSRGTAASPTTLVDNDVLSQLLFYGHDGTDYAHAAGLIRVKCNGTVATNQMPGEMSFFTNHGTTYATERLKIQANGRITMGEADFDASNDLHLKKANSGGDVAMRITNNSGTNSGTTASLYFTTSPTQDFNTSYIQAVRDGGKLNFGYSTNSPTVCMRVSNRHVGINTDNPTSLLEVHATQNDTNNLQYAAFEEKTNGNGQQAFGLTLRSTARNNSGLEPTAFIKLETRAVAADGSHGGNAFITFTPQGVTQGTYGSGKLDFYIRTGGPYTFNNDPGNTGEMSPKMSLTPEGDGSSNLRLGATSATNIYNSSGTGNEGAWLVAGGASQFSGSNTDIMRLNRKSYNGKILLFYYNGSEVGSVSTNANSLPSDRNFKTNISDLNLGLSFVNKLKPSKFNYKIDESNTPVMYGLIAQELEESLTSEGVSKNSTQLIQHHPTDDTESDYDVDYGKLTPVLINAIKELSTEINNLKAKVAALEGS